MMDPILPRSWKEEFERVASYQREEILYREKMKRFEAREQERREHVQIEEQRHEQEAFRAFEMAIATPEIIAATRLQWDNYDTRTIEALMDNQEAFDRIRVKLDRMRAEAHTLPDGRRVFKTEDGQRVMDEHGQEVSPDVVDPSMIDNKKPKWEAFKAATDEEVRLTRERQELQDFQAKLDAARERLDKGDITNGELEEIKTDLATSMPDAVREKLGLERPKAEAAQNVTASGPSLPNDMDALMRQTGFGAPHAP